MTRPSAESTVREPIPADCTVRVEIGPSLCLADMVSLEGVLRSAMRSDPIRIVLDARSLRTMTQGAGLALLGATARLERAGVELIVERCRPSARLVLQSLAAHVTAQAS